MNLGQYQRVQLEVEPILCRSISGWLVNASCELKHWLRVGISSVAIVHKAPTRKYKPSRKAFGTNPILFFRLEFEAQVWGVNSVFVRAASEVLMAPHDTPPTSPGVNLPPDLEEEEAGEAGAGDLDLGDVVEVIDLDELVEQAQGMDDDDEEDSLEAMASEDESEQPLEPPPEDNSAQSFLGHGRSVFNVSFHPKNPNWAASGGEDDCAYIWDTGTGEVVLKCDGFNDSVVFVAFSHDGSFLAASDMSGVIKVWRTSSKEVIWEFETSDISWMSWHQSGNVLFVTTVDSELWMWKIPSGESKLFAGHGEKAETAKVLHDGKRAIVGYSDGSLRLFDLKSGEVLHNLSGNTGHVASVTSIAVRDDNNLIGSGGVDGTAKLFNIQSGKNIGTFKCGSKDEDSEEVDSKSTVEATLFSKPEMNLLITGTLEGTINIWDLASHVSRQAFSVGTGITKMEWRQGSSTEILVATLDGLVRLADVRVGKILADFSGHTASILDFAQSSDGSKLITASDDGTCKVYNVAKVLESS